MQTIKRQNDSESLPAQCGILERIESCLAKGCVFCIEHTPSITGPFTSWRRWARPVFYEEQTQVRDEIERCRNTHRDHHIRLSVEDYRCRSRLCFVVHDPAGTS